MQRRRRQREIRDADADAGVYRSVPAELSGEVHDLLVSDGSMRLLGKDLPYLVFRARGRTVDNARSDQRRRARQLLVAKDQAPRATDPVEIILQADGFRQLLNALARLPDGDLYLLWWSASGYSHSEIVEQWKAVGLKNPPLSTTVLRKRLSRARSRAKQELNKDETLSEN